MALVTNNISSSLDNTTIGITGSLIIGKAATLPSMPGTDVTFFVSGTNGGVTAGTGVAVFGGDVVISGSLHGGSPLKIGTDAGLTGSLRLANRVGATPSTATGEAILFASESSPGVTKLYFAAGGGAAAQVGSATGTPGGSDTNVQFNNGGTFGGASGFRYTTSTETVSAANLIVTGTSAGSLTTSGTFQVKNTSNAVVGSMSTAGVVSGSGQLQGASVNVDGTITAGSNIAVNGGTITTTQGTLTLGASTNRVLVPGDFEVQGTTVTVDVTNITVEDPLIALGFTSGSTAASSGDRGFIGGRSGTSNVAFAWAQTSDAFVATTTTSVPGDTSISFTPAELKPVRASRFQVSGTNAVVFSPDGTNLIVGSTVTSEMSGSLVQLNASTNGVSVLRDGSPFMGITSGSNATSANLSRIIASNNKSILLGAPAGQLAFISGAQVYLNAGNNGTMFQRNAADMFQINSADGSTLNLAAQTGYTTANIVNAVSTTVNFAGAATRVNIGASVGTGSFAGSLEVTGSTTLGDATTDDIVFNARAASSLLPKTDVLYNLGGPSNRWANIYTGDLHLKNDRGDYTLIEEEDFLSIRFNKTGKRYKFVLEPVPELDEK